MTSSPSSRRIAVYTLGCKVNQYETACIAGQFTALGWTLVPFSAEADVYVINTCTVTAQADVKSRGAVRRALRRKMENPAIRVVVTGCWAQRFPQRAAALGSVDLVAGIQEKALVEKLLAANTAVACAPIESADTFSEMSTSALPGRTRAFVKVQDGCNFHCAYCAVWMARGASRSRTLESTVAQVRRLAETGYREIVLGGINLGLWGSEWGQGLDVLVRAIAAVPGIERVRLSSLEPQFLDDRLLDGLFACPAFAPHLHIPVQSGSNALLAAMGRRYDTVAFREAIQRVLTRDSLTGLGFDVITGLPGETDERFEETRAFLDSLPLAYLHVFTYSRRPGTRAAAMPGQVRGDVAAERSRVLHALGVRKGAAFRARLLSSGTRLWAAAETCGSEWSEGMSDRWARIAAPGKHQVLAGVPTALRGEVLEIAHEEDTP